MLNYQRVLMLQHQILTCKTSTMKLTGIQNRCRRLAKGRCPRATAQPTWRSWVALNFRQILSHHRHQQHILCPAVHAWQSYIKSAKWYEMFMSPWIPRTYGLQRPLLSFLILSAHDHLLVIFSTIWLFNIAMGNGPFIDGLAIKNGDFPWLC